MFDLVQLVNASRAIDESVLAKYVILRKTLLKIVLRCLACFSVDGDWLQISINFINSEQDLVNQILKNSAFDEMPLEYNSG